MKQGGFDTAPDSFLELSRILTGYNHLSPELAAEYHKALLGFPKVMLATLLAEYERKIMDQLPALKTGLVKSLLWDEPAYKQTCIFIIDLWYTSALSIDNNPVYTGTAMAYAEALFPKTAQAHQLAISGGYQGYWHYPPEN